MLRALGTLGIGFFSGILSGMFGIGGGIITTPAIRLLLGAPALVAVGTPLVAIIPSALSGSYQYWRKGLVDVRSALTLGLCGMVTAVIGARLTVYVGGSVVLLLTAVLIFYMAGSMLWQGARPKRNAPTAEELEAAIPVDSVSLADQPLRPSLLSLIAAGALTGLYSGFLGLGGGFVLVPLLTRWLHFPVKRAIAASLVAISVLAIPGAITHALLGNIDWAIAAGLAVGVIPGAALGARIALGSSDAKLRIGFALLLVASGVLLAVTELAAMRA